MSSVHGDIHSQGKHIIFNVYTYFKNLSKDSSQPEVANFFLQAQQKTAEACGVSRRTVQRISSEGSKATSDADATISFSSPRKTFKKAKYATGIDDFNKDVVRRTVHEFYDLGQFPVSSKILSKYQEKTGYKGSQASMRRILKSLGFRYKKCNDGRKFLMEKSDIVAARIRFLTQMANLRQNNDVRPVVYLDETWINQNHTRGIWQNTEGTTECIVPTGKTDRIIICHAGSSSFGFVKGSKLVFRCTSGSSEDHNHTQMNYEVFKGWFIKMLQNLNEPSVIVMDNASYHSGSSEDNPKSNSKRKILPQEKKYELDEMALSMGHEVVRLPLHHCQYNPMELIWAQVKEKVAEKNATFKIADVEKLVHDALDSVTVDDWKNYTNHCHKLQDDDYVKEGLREQILEPIILTISPDDSSDSGEDESC